MIEIFFNKDGYYIRGNSTEASMYCSQALDSRGRPIFQEIHHTYKVLYLALKAIRSNKSLCGDVIVYNDSRIIDEMNGEASYLDEINQAWVRAIRREMISGLRSAIFFRKKPSDFVKSGVELGRSHLITEVSPEMYASIQASAKEKAVTFKQRALNRFKRIWNDTQQ